MTKRTNDCGTDNQFDKILGLFDLLPDFAFARIEMMCGYYL